MTRILALLAVLVLPLAACDDGSKAEAPRPAEITSESTGYFCGMLLADHAGPKGQVHQAGQREPLWFSSVRDTIAYTRMPGEARNIRAIYVNDMGRAHDWARPEPDTWIEAEKAFYVVGSEMRGGMGAPEAVPFGEEAQARRFVDQHGGQIMRLAEIPDSYVVGPPDEGALVDGETERSHRHVEH